MQTRLTFSTIVSLASLPPRPSPTAAEMVSTMPLVFVGSLAAATTILSQRTTASVFVSPISTPITYVQPARASSKYQKCADYSRI